MRQTAVTRHSTQTDKLTGPILHTMDPFILFPVYPNYLFFLLPLAIAHPKGLQSSAVFCMLLGWGPMVYNLVSCQVQVDLPGSNVCSLGAHQLVSLGGFYQVIVSQFRSL